MRRVVLLTVLAGLVGAISFAVFDSPKATIRELEDSELPPVSRDPFVGYFSEGDLAMSIHRQGNDYMGSVRKGNATFSVSARPIAEQPSGFKLQGQFSVRGRSYPFALTTGEKGYRFMTADTEYALNRAGQARPTEKPAFTDASH